MIVPASRTGVDTARRDDRVHGRRVTGSATEMLADSSVKVPFTLPRPNRCRVVKVMDDRAGSTW
ncbi:hypothetical protein ACFVYV_50945 [Streptomyces mirabilis]|uniref:hypothetical protein n=1 Tax=Streptomyces mirabilis TaxID=68239 RepID=UPI0036D94F7C